MSLMALPVEIRLDIYEYLLVHPHHNGMPMIPLPHRKGSTLHPSILLVNRQINTEGTPILYGRNSFLAHPTMLKSFPSLASGLPPLREAAVIPRIRRFYIRVRLDCDTNLRQEDVTRAFSGVEGLVIDVWQAMFLGADHSALRVFEGVRNVKNPRVTGSTTGFHEYARWLEGAMKGEVGSLTETSEGASDHYVQLLMQPQYNT